MDINSILNNIHVKNITKILKDVGERVEGNLICDIRPDNYVISSNESKIKNLQYLCKNKKKIIEIGVNGCHSLLLMLLINPNAEYLLFDLGNHKYTIPTLNYIKTQFPDTKINMIFGNSIETIPEYIRDNQNNINSFDLIHLDGGHTEDIFSQDYINSKKLIVNKGIIIFDDYNMHRIKGFINRKIKDNEIIELNDKNIIKNNKHFIYSYL
uniref:Class I SAM-dependent methyltransferase n=1 Tax=viral metagenome TaxID=1070528 RepID=A0A6C0ENW0_9ZZZZ